MLTSIQNKLKHTACPSCEKKNVLQAVLACSRDDKKCTTNCHCSNCGLSLIVSLPDGVDEAHIGQHDLVMVCDIVTSKCELQPGHIGIKTG
jgi:transcription elongation factor Elf1